MVSIPTEFLYVSVYIYICVCVHIYMHTHTHFAYSERLEEDQINKLILP